MAEYKKVATFAANGTGAKIIDVTAPADQIADGGALVQVEGLGKTNLYGPPNTMDAIQTWWESTPHVADHDDDQSIPEGSVRVTCVAPPADDLRIRIVVL